MTDQFRTPRPVGEQLTLGEPCPVSGTFRVDDQQPPEGNLDVVIGEIDVDANGVSQIRETGRRR